MIVDTSQCTDTLLMVRPYHFRFNEQTAVNNYYVEESSGAPDDEIYQQAEAEFDNFVDVLRGKGVNVMVIQDNAEPDTPDAVFPNNWISLHSDGRVGLYPMYAPNRRWERREDIVDLLKDNFRVESVVDFTDYELKEQFLEATGSMVLDRQNRIAYAALSERTAKVVFEDYCSTFNYKPISFIANQSVNGQRLPIYHTNVLMCVGDDFAVLCLDAVDDGSERETLLKEFEAQGQELIVISEEQTQQFAGNMLQIRSTVGEKYIVMSSSAYNSLRRDQIEALKQYGEIIHCPLGIIEKLGGGSARCMMAEVFLPKK